MFPYSAAYFNSPALIQTGLPSLPPLFLGGPPKDAVAGSAGGAAAGSTTHSTEQGKPEMRDLHQHVLLKRGRDSMLWPLCYQGQYRVIAHTEPSQGVQLYGHNRTEASFRKVEEMYGQAADALRQAVLKAYSGPSGFEVIRNLGKLQHEPLIRCSDMPFPEDAATTAGSYGSSAQLSAERVTPKGGRTGGGGLSLPSLGSLSSSLPSMVIPEVCFLLDNGQLCVAEGLGSLSDPVTGCGLYQGSWLCGMRHGHGVGSIYCREAGAEKEGSAEKRGGEPSSSSSSSLILQGEYDGEWLLGSRCGWGTLTEANGDLYEGQWQWDCRSGQGTEVYQGGGQLKGWWCRDRKHGLCTFTWPLLNRVELRHYSHGTILSSQLQSPPHSHQLATPVAGGGGLLPASSSALDLALAAAGAAPSTVAQLQTAGLTPAQAAAAVLQAHSAAALTAAATAGASQSVAATPMRPSRISSLASFQAHTAAAAGDAGAAEAMHATGASSLSSAGSAAGSGAQTVAGSRRITPTPSSSGALAGEAGAEQQAEGGPLSDVGLPLQTVLAPSSAAAPGGSSSSTTAAVPGSSGAMPPTPSSGLAIAVPSSGSSGAVSSSTSAAAAASATGPTVDTVSIPGTTLVTIPVPMSATMGAGGLQMGLLSQQQQQQLVAAATAAGAAGAGMAVHSHAPANANVLSFLRHSNVNDIPGGRAATGEVITVDKSDSVEVCLARMTENNVLSLPVFDKASDKYCAMLHILDVLAFMLDLVAKKKHPSGSLSPIERAPAALSSGLPSAHAAFAAASGTAGVNGGGVSSHASPATSPGSHSHTASHLGGHHAHSLSASAGGGSSFSIHPALLAAGVAGGHGGSSAPGSARGEGAVGSSGGGLGLREALAHQRRFAAAPVSEVLDMRHHISPIAFRPLPLGAPLIYAVQALAEGMHAVPIVDAGGKLQRVLTQADIIRFLAHHLDELGSLGPMTVGELGLGERGADSLVVARFSDRAFEVFQRLREKQSPAAPVVNSYGAMAANISFSDLKAIAKKANFNALQLPVQQMLAQAEKGSEVMNPSIYVKASTHFQSLVLTLAMTKVHQVYFVSDALNPIGCVRIADVLKVLIGC